MRQRERKNEESTQPCVHSIPLSLRQPTRPNFWKKIYHLLHVTPSLPPHTHDQRKNQLDIHMNANEGKKVEKDLLRSLRNSERSKSLAELGWGSGRLLESLTRMDSEDWKMQRRKPRTNVNPIDLIQRCIACSIFFLRVVVIEWLVW